MKSKHFFIFACLLASLELVFSEFSLSNFGDLEFAEFLDECLLAGFATAGVLQNNAIVSKFSNCDSETETCLGSIFSHTFKIASFQANSLSLCQGQGMLQTSLLVKNRLGIPVESVVEVLSNIDLSEDTCRELFASCVGFQITPRPQTFVKLASSGIIIPECANDRNRHIDGYCNNLINLEYGMPFRPFNRLLPPVYEDGLNLPRGFGTDVLPPPRSVSQLLMSVPPSPIPQIVTQMVKVWGQFLDHDLTRTPEASAGMGEEGETLILECCEDDEFVEADPSEISPECLPLRISQEDTFFTSRGIECLPFVRSTPAATGCILGPREQTNEVTAFLDGSNVYGSTPEEEEDLRNWIDGQLVVATGDQSEEIQPESCTVNVPLPLLPPGSDDPEPSFRAGDIRVNEQPSLASMHTIWVRVHNKIATILARTTINSDEGIYQEARRIVIALMQHFTYNDFLPLVIGRRAMLQFRLYSLPGNLFNSMYQPLLNPSIYNVFATAAFRFGHTLITDEMSGLDPFRLGDKFFRSGNLLRENGTHPSSILEMEARMQALPTDVILDDVLTTRLALGPPENTEEGFPDHGNDLMALNIMRAREHGIPGYTAWRRFCGLDTITSFGGLRKVMDKNTADAFGDQYLSVDDIDLFPAGLAENAALGGGILGPTFSCLIGLQFYNLKYGDRFFYENSGFIHLNNPDIAFTPLQLRLIKDATFAEILCEVTCAATLPRDVYHFNENQPEITCGEDRSILFEALEADQWIR